MIVAQPAQSSSFDMQPAQLPDVQPAQMLPDEPAQLQPIVQPAEEEEKEVVKRPSGNVNVADETFATIKKEYKAHFATPLRQGWRTHSFIRKALKLDEKLLSFKSESDVILVLVQLMLVGLLD